MIARWFRPSPEQVILIATVLSALNALVALDILHLSGLHLAVVNIGLACVLGVVGSGLMPSEPGESCPAEGRAQHRERGST